jgi:hypothetical protein
MRASVSREVKMFRKKWNSSALTLLEKHAQELGNECLEHSEQLGIISQELRNNWQKEIQHEADFILSVGKGRKALLNTIVDIKKSNKREIERRAEYRFQISSLFLRDCWAYLTSDPRLNERIHLITGTITEDGTRVSSRMEKVKYEKQSAVYVSVDKDDSHQKIIALTEEYGHLVLGVFHSHMSRGLIATTPSSTDQSFMERMAKIGCHCLGGIFSLDGYARFFMKEENFEIEVYGKGFKMVEESPSCKVYKIVGGENYGRKSIQNKASSHESVG